MEEQRHEIIYWGISPPGGFYQKLSFTVKTASAMAQLEVEVRVSEGLLNYVFARWGTEPTEDTCYRLGFKAIEEKLRKGETPPAMVSLGTPPAGTYPGSSGNGKPEMTDESEIEDYPDPEHPNRKRVLIEMQKPKGKLGS